MKHRITSALLGVLALATLALPAAIAAPGELWFDLDKCEMCKNMSSEEGLMEHMEWENHLTKDGMVSVTVVADGYEEAFHRSMKNMEATGQKLMTGEKLYLCGFCQSFGALQMAGAQSEHIETGVGTINLMTSRDPAVVAKIHAHGQRTMDEYAKMVAAEGHEDHPHKDQ
jgi:hypothetical protein